MQHHYTVRMRPDGRWQGGHATALVPFMVCDTQLEAEELMCTMAEAMGRSHVVIHGPGGEVLRDRVFGPVVIDALS